LKLRVVSAVKPLRKMMQHVFTTLGCLAYLH